MQTERLRQTLSSPLTLEQMQEYQRQGWRAVAVEWERESAGVTPSKRQVAEEPPFGLQVADNCASLEENPEEAEILATMMELIIQDGPYSLIAQELNRKGFVTRRGSKWNPVSVFEMLPRLIEAGPKIFSSEEWRRRRVQSKERRQGLPI